MNTELIKKYKKEFDYWLNEGKLLCYTEVGGPYYEVNDEKWDFVCDIGFVINDEYVKFRKALAEGKTVQYNFGNFGPNKIDFPNVWKDLDTSIGILSERTSLENYRIKPREPRFQIGEWVHIPELNGEPCKYREDLCMLGLEKWEPHAGEWCWNYVFGLVKVICKTKTEGYFVCWNPWKKVEQTITIDSPFIGTLPTNLGNK